MHPSVDRRGRWIHFASYHHDGWHIERIPFAPGEWFDPQPTDERFAGTPPDSAGSAPVAVAGRNYRALPTLRPHHWIPMFTPAERGTSVLEGTRHTVFEPFVGLATEGQDLVGRHLYTLDARVTLDGERFTGNFGYGYHGFGNPVLGLAAGQSYDASASTIPVPVSATDSVEFFLVERERWATLSASFRRNRYRSAVGFSLSGSVVRENLSLQDPQGNPGDSLYIREQFRRSTFTQLRATLSASNAQLRAFSISREDGVGGWVSARTRRNEGLDADQRGELNLDRSFTELTGELSAYKGFRAWGFANHVLALRLSAGRGFGPGANRFHFDIGGAEGAPEALTGFGLFGGSPRLFPLRGYAGNTRFGQVAWTASAEYRFPIALIDRGLGPLPLFFDRVHGSVFFDAGNAWGPEEGPSHPRYDNPAGETLLSCGVEASAIVAPVYLRGLTLRFGAGFPLVDPGVPTEPVYYIRIGNAF